MCSFPSRSADSIASRVHDAANTPQYAAFRGRVASSRTLPYGQGLGHRNDAVVVRRTSTVLELVNTAREIRPADLQLASGLERGPSTSTTYSTQWFLADDSRRGVMVDESLGTPPLTSAGASRQTPLPLWNAVAYSSAAGSGRATTRLPVALEEAEEVLRLGTLLTVVGSATLTSDGLVKFAAGTGTSVLSERPLHDVVDSFLVSVRRARSVETALVVAGVALATYGLYKRFFARES